MYYYYLLVVKSIELNHNKTVSLISFTWGQIIIFFPYNFHKTIVLTYSLDYRLFTRLNSSKYCRPFSENFKISVSHAFPKKTRRRSARKKAAPTSVQNGAEGKRNSPNYGKYVGGKERERERARRWRKHSVTTGNLKAWQHLVMTSGKEAIVRLQGRGRGS